jgi:hypothetical protein
MSMRHDPCKNNYLLSPNHFITWDPGRPSWPSADKTSLRDRVTHSPEPEVVEIVETSHMTSRVTSRDVTSHRQRPPPAHFPPAASV